MKIEQTECSEMSAYKIQTPGNYPEEKIQHSEHGESLKSRILNISTIIKCPKGTLHYEIVTWEELTTHFHLTSSRCTYKPNETIIYDIMLKVSLKKSAKYTVWKSRSTRKGDKNIILRAVNPRIDVANVEK